MKNRFVAVFSSGLLTLTFLSASPVEAYQGKGAKQAQMSEKMHERMAAELKLTPEQQEKMKALKEKSKTDLKAK